MTSTEKRLAECLFDLTLLAAPFIEKYDIDSREVFQVLCDWAEDFEETFDDENEDYLTEIENYFWSHIDLSEVER